VGPGDRQLRRAPRRTRPPTTSMTPPHTPPRTGGATAVPRRRACPRPHRRGQRGAPDGEDDLASHPAPHRRGHCRAPSALVSSRSSNGLICSAFSAWLRRKIGPAPLRVAADLPPPASRPRRRRPVVSL
jgi:hypothetical protein